MAKFSIDGTTDPFVRVQLDQGDKIAAERDAMAAMSDTISLGGKARGGVFKSLARAVTTGESFFMQEMTADKGPGNVMLSPRHPGEVHLIELDNDEWMLSDGSFLAADDSLALETVRQKSIGTALVGGTGGFFQLKVSGSGMLAVSGVGAVRQMKVSAGEELIVDSGHAVAWPASLSSKASLSTGQGGGFIKKAVGSAKSGEGVVLRFDGGTEGGVVLISSRSRPSFIGWITDNSPSK